MPVIPGHSETQAIIPLGTAFGARFCETKPLEGPEHVNPGSLAPSMPLPLGGQTEQRIYMKKIDFSKISFDHPAPRGGTTAAELLSAVCSSDRR